MSYVNKRTVLFLPFQYEWLLFPFIVFLHCPELPSKGWVKVVRTDLFAFFPALEGKYKISYWFLQMFFNKLRKSSLFLFFCELYHEQMLNFVKCFFYIFWDDHMVLSMQCITLNDLCMLNSPCEPEMNSTWSWCMLFLKICCWIWFANTLLRIFVSIFVKDIGL